MRNEWTRATRRASSMICLCRKEREGACRARPSRGCVSHTPRPDSAAVLGPWDGMSCPDQSARMCGPVHPRHSECKGHRLDVVVAAWSSWPVVRLDVGDQPPPVRQRPPLVVARSAPKGFGHCMPRTCLGIGMPWTRATARASSYLGCRKGREDACRARPYRGCVSRTPRPYSAAVRSKRGPWHIDDMLALGFT